MSLFGFRLLERGRTGLWLLCVLRTVLALPGILPALTLALLERGRVTLTLPGILPTRALRLSLAWLWAFLATLSVLRTILALPGILPTLTLAVLFTVFRTVKTRNTSVPYRIHKLRGGWRIQALEGRRLYPVLIVLQIHPHL